MAILRPGADLPLRVPFRPLLRGRSRGPLVAMWLRTAVVAALAGALVLAIDGPAPKADFAWPAVAQVAVPPSGEARLDALAARAASPEGPRISWASLLDPDDAAATHFAAGAEPALSPERFTTPAAAAAAASGAWIEREFASTAALDGRTLATEGLRIRLIGLDLPMAEQVCRTLDGRFEPCRTRAVTQLELLTRGRTVTCLYRLERPGEAEGRCRIGFSDLTERMIRTGYAWPAAVPARSTS